MTEHYDGVDGSAPGLPAPDPRMARRDVALARFAARLDKVSARAESLQRQVGRKDRELTVLTGQIEDVRSQLALCQQERAALVASRSWKITAPLRSVSTLARRLNPKKF